MPDKFESGDAPGGITSTQVLSADQVLRGQLSTLSDVDWYKINLVAGQTYIGAAVGTGTNSLKDPVLELRDATGTLIASADDGLPNANSFAKYTATASGTYFLAVKSFNSENSGQYGLSFTAQNKAVFDADMSAGVMNTYFTWATGRNLPATVTFGFRDSGPTYAVEGSDMSQFSVCSTSEQATVRQILNLFSDVCGLTFSDVNPNGLTNNAAMLFGNYTDPNDGAGAFAYSPGPVDPTDQSGDVWLNTDSISTTDNPPGSYDFATIMHEIGHAMGLSHPGEYNAAPGTNINFAQNAQFFRDSEQYTVMSYFDAVDTGAVVPAHPVTLMVSDIEALQVIYGANSTTRSTDTVYGFNATVGGIYDFAAIGLSAMCIWDGGGTDTLDVSGFAQDQLVSIAAGSFSNIGGMTASLSIAMRAVIENAVGGSGNDQINGGDGANRLTGGLGNDSLAGGLGADVLDGGDGTDAADYRQSTGTTVNVSLLANTGTGGQAEGDTFINIENLLGSLTQRDILIGDDNANAIYGNGGDDSLRGEGGDDYLVGGRGADAINAGAGTSDWASYVTNAAGQITVNLLTNVNTGGDAQGDTLFFVENLEGSLRIRSILIGNDIANSLLGHSGNDSIRGEAGNDIIEGGEGADSLNAGAGIDTVTYERSAAGVTVDLRITTQVSAGEASGDSLFFFENVTGSAQADTLNGNYFNNRLVGGLGADKLDGGTGSDVLTGGGGADTFRFQDLSFGSDRIADWEDGVDKISIALPLETSFEGLQLTNNGTTSVMIRGFNTSGTIVVQSASAFTLDASDFIFV